MAPGAILRGKYENSKMIMRCALFGHQYEYLRVNPDGMGHVVKCVRCGKEDVWSNVMCCNHFGHELVQGVCVRCGVRITPNKCPGHEFDVIAVRPVEITSGTIFGGEISVWTQRYYRCRLCSEVYCDKPDKMDPEEHLLQGRWSFSEDGRRLAPR